MNAAAARRPFVKAVARRGGLPLGLILASLAAAGGALVAFLRLDGLPWALCYFKLVTGLPCTTCGTTRGLARLVRGDLAGAFAMNPLATVALLGLAVWAVVDAVLLMRGRALALSVAPALRRPAVVLAVVALLANWAYLVAAGR